MQQTMKKILFMLVALLTISASTMSVSAQVSNSFATVAAGDYAGTYNGDLTKVYMNTDKDPVSGVTSTVTENTSGTINIHMDAFQIGSMPGTITIDANNIAVNSDGTFAQTCTRAVTLRILGIPTRYNAYVDGSIVNGELTYTITVNSEYSGALFTAIVTFKGNK